MTPNLKTIKASQLQESIRQSLKEFVIAQPAMQTQPQQPAVEPMPEQPVHVVDDEIGNIFIVKTPIEGGDITHIIDECSVMDLNHKLTTGELQKENILAICKSSASANRRAGKILQEFHKTIVKSRKNELKELKNKKEYWESRVEATNKLHGGEEMLDETQKMKLSKIRKGLDKNDKRIIELENLLRSNKEGNAVENDDK